MAHKDHIARSLEEWERWVFRRREGIPNNKKLFVLACMDERLPVEEVLELGPGDAHVFRNAGGLVTDDAIRSAALTIHFFDTQEIIIVNHTECGMLAATGEEITSAVEEKTGLDLSQVTLDPGLENFKLSRSEVNRWWKMQSNIDEASLAQAEVFRNHPLIPEGISITPYVYEVESGHLRQPNHIRADKTRGTFRQH